MNRKILITGASSGIGQATAVHLAQKGHQVLMAARRIDRLKTLASESATVVGEFLIGELDLSQKSSIDAFTKTHGAWLKDVDVLVNNAGLAIGREAFNDAKFEDIQQVINTNVTGLLELTRQVLGFMKARKSGHIINLGSVAGRTAYAGGSVYCATKAAIHMFTEALRYDLAGSPIRVTTIAPGRVSTEFSLVRYRGDSEKAQQVYEGFEALQPEDIAECIAWSLERPKHVNIQEMVIYPTEQPSATTVVPFKK